ncbi:MAG TPA: ABC transporter ATP-binding protein [Burkholderiales bacterium]|nr:ABC transporter ATP-binding protein [Burkholderiales bacterium]
MLSIRGLRKRYGGPGARQVLDDIDFELGAGEYVAIRGESGVGKSTLLNLIAGLDTPDAGSVAIDGVDLGALDDDARTLLRRNRMGFVFQAFHLLPHLTVVQNTALPLRIAGRDEAESVQRALNVLEALSLAALAQRYPRSLSGGETQRVAIARALVHEPRLILADEPTGNLDEDTAAVVLGMLRDAVKMSGGAGILVTHSARAAATTDRTYVLTARGLALQNAA